MKGPYTDKHPRFHTQRLKDRMEELIAHLKQSVDAVNEPRAEALFETSAEVIGGLLTAFEHYEAANEAAWQEEES